MKITYMIKRERFFEINERTLKKYYAESRKSRRLYIYPELNAIVTARPSASVKEYLYTEYRVSGSFLKRIAVKLYAFIMLNSFGIFASKRVKLPNGADQNTLIYPCNKKYRIFDFKKNTVSVIPKEGFPTGDLKNEIEFRSRNRADFIPDFISFDENGYTEAIIDGLPVARSGDRVPELCDRAYETWSAYIAPTCESVEVASYAKVLEDEAQALLAELSKRGKTVDADRVRGFYAKLVEELLSYGGEVLIGLSHGDLQSGNIWVENGTSRIYIIDWESYGRRSLAYDKATLYENLRMVGFLAKYVKVKDLSHGVVLAEDMIFRLKELTNLPENFGAEDFEGYLRILEERYV